MPLKMNKRIHHPAKTSRHKTARKAKTWQYGLLSFLLVLLTLTVWSIFNITEIKDWYILATYHPPESIKQLVSEDTMTSYARKLFLVNKPQIEDKSAFAANCSTTDPKSHVIGCYHGGDNGIFLLKVTDPRLNGIIPVTAAYEMLHAGYARLNSSERTLIDKAMWQFYTQANISSEIKQQMASYAISEPGARYDELYSVLGTEVAKLPPNLEVHYKIYFNDRAKIITAYNGYQLAFNSLEQTIASNNIELSFLRSQISNNESQLSSLLSSINSQEQVLNSERNSGSLDAYNAGVPEYNSLVDRYNTLADLVRSDINQFNAIVSSSNALALEEQQLEKAISSSPSVQAAK